MSEFPESTVSSSREITGNKKTLRRSLSIATAIMMGSVLLSRVAGLFREQVLASFGGTSSEMDAYVAAFMIPELLNHFLAGGFLSITFIPIYQRHAMQGDKPRAWLSFSNLICIGSALFLILIPLAIIFTPQILKIMGSQISADPQRLAITVRLTRIILPAQIFFYWGAAFTALQMAEHRFFLPALAPLCYNIGIIAGGLLLGPYMGIEGFAWGVLAGAFLGNFVLQVPGIIKLGVKFSPKFNLSDPDFIGYVKTTLPLIVGLGMTFSNEIFFRFFGSFLDEGGISSVNFALRTTMMVVAVFGQASGVAFYPYLAKMAAQKQFEKMTELLNSVLTKIAVYLIPLSAIMIILSRQIIAILFERGNFDHQSTIRTASVFSIYLLGSFTFSASMIVARTFYATGNTILPMVISTLTSFLSIPLYIAFSRALGGPGIALAAILGMNIQFLTLYIIWCKRHGQLQSASVAFVNIMKIMIVCLVVSSMALMIRRWSSLIDFNLGRQFSNLLVCAITTAPSLLAVFLLYELSGIQRFRESIGALLKMRRRS